MTKEKKNKADAARHSEAGADGKKDHHSDAATKQIQQQHQKEAHELAAEKAARARAEAAHSQALRKAEQARQTADSAKAHKSPDVQALSPDERSRAGIKSCKDTHGATFHYDNHGRLIARETKDGCRALFKYGADGKANGFELKTGKNHLLADVYGKSKIEFNQKDGSVKVVTTGGDAKSHLATTVTCYHADNKIETQTLDHKNRPLSMTLREPSDGAAGTKLVTRCDFRYADRNGKPTADANQIDDSKPVLALIQNDRGQVTDRYQFGSTAAVHLNRPALHETITCTVDTKNHQVSEHHQSFDLRSGGRQFISSVNNIYDARSGEATVDTRLADGSFQHIKFDKGGKAVELSHQDRQHNLSYTLKQGAITGVLDNGQKIGDLVTLHTFLKLGGHAIASNLETSSHAKNDVGALNHELALEPPGRPGTKPSGTLVLSENGTLHQVPVKDGTFSYKDKSGHLQKGSVHDDGSFEVAGRKANIKDQSEGGAFHGIGSDGTRLDISSDKDKGGFNGILKDGRSAGHPTYGVINGNIYDKNGSFRGHLDAAGNVYTPGGPSAGTRINSINDGCSFEGTENGKHRTFICNDGAPMSHGRMFIPGPHGPEEYEVRLGMVINKRTGNQLGILVPPKVQGEAMTGGEIYRTDTHPPRAQALCSLKNAVFDIDLFERKGAFGTAKLRGACLGTQEHDLAGHITGGGLLNVAAAINTQNDALAASAQKEAANTGFHFSVDSVSGAQGDLANAARADQRSAQMVLDSLNRMMTTGKVSAHTFQQIGAITSNTKIELVGGDETISGQRLQIDQARVPMEKLPDNARQLNGHVLIVDKHAPHGHQDLQIKNGIVYGKDGKTQVARIDGPDGHMTMFNPATKQLVPGSMRSLTGSVWHLNWKDKNNHEQSAALVSLGENDGLTSISALRKQAHLETQAAIVANRESSSDESKALLADTQNAEVQFNRRLDRILKTGTELADVNFLKKGAGHVRMDASSADDPPPEAPRQKLEVAGINTTKDAQSTNGKLRIDNHVYKIDHGQLYEMTIDHGHSVVSHKPAGALLPGYNVQFSGGENINLAEHHRVLMQFTLGNSKDVHQIIGLGPARNTDSFGQTEGGLVPIDDLYRQADEAKQKARQGNLEYFQNRPYITGWFANASMGNREESLAAFAKTLDSQTQRLKQKTSDLFVNGFDVQKVNNNKLDGAVDLTQLMVNNIGADASSSVGLARDGRQVQKMTNDAFIMAVETVATAGVGEVFAFAKNAKNLSTMVALAGEVSTDVVLCGGISMVGRATDSSRASDNFYSGMVEGGVMGLGSVGAKAFGSLAQLQQTEALAVAVRNGSVVLADLAPAERAMLSTGIGQMCMAGKSASYIKAVSALYKVTDSVVQTTGFNIAGNIREHNWDSMNVQSIAVGSSAMLFGQVLGHGFGSGAEKYLGIAQDGPVGQLVNNVAMSYGNGAAGAVDGALDKERERIADQFHISKELVSMNMLYKYVNWDNVVSDVNNAGLMASISAPLLTVGSHAVTDRLQAKLTPEEHAARKTQEQERRAKFAGDDGDTSQHTKAQKLLVKLKQASQADVGQLLAGDRGASAANHGQDKQAGPPQAEQPHGDVTDTGNRHAQEGNANTGLSEHHSQRYVTSLNAAARELEAQHHSDLASGYVAAAALVAMEPHGDLTLETRIRIAGTLRRNAERYQEKGQHDLASGYEAAADSLIPDRRHPQPVDHQHSYGQAIQMRDELQQTMIKVGPGDWPTEADFQLEEEHLPNGARRFRRSNGVLTENADGSEIFVDKRGITLERNVDGRITAAVDVSGVRRQYSYDHDGTLDGVTFSNGENWRKVNAGNWQITSAEGTVQRYHNDYVIEPDGSLREKWKPGADEAVSRLDGSMEVHRANGRVEYTEARIDTEKAQLESLAQSHFIFDSQKQRFAQFLNDFNARAQKVGITDQQIALTYHQINRLLQAGYEAPLNLYERTRLAEQIMYAAAYPHLIDQGRNPTCNVATVEDRIFARQPDMAARLIVDVATSGKYTTADGTLIDLTRVPGAIRPDAESERALKNLFKQDGTLDIKIDGQRNWASQIFEITAANVKWARTKEMRTQPGDVLMFTKPEGKEVNRLVHYSVDSNGQMVTKEVGQSPLITTADLTDIHNQITGGADRDFVLIGPVLNGAAVQSTAVNNLAEFEAALTDMKVKNNFPGILLVDARNEPFSKFIGTDGHTEAWHVVNVQDIHTDPLTGKMMVEFTNQWGEQANHLGDKAVTAEQLFEATKAKPVANGQGEYDLPGVGSSEAVRVNPETSTHGAVLDSVREVKEGDGVETRSAIKPEDLFDYSRIEQVSGEIADLFHDRPMTSDQFAGMFKKMSEGDRKIALELLESAAGNMNSRALDTRLQDLANRMGASGKITVYTLGPDSVGNPLAYLFRKNNPGVDIEIKIIDKAGLQAMAERNNSDVAPIASGPSLVFDDVSLATTKQKGFLRRQTHLTVADLGGFERGLNLWDFGATKYAGPELMERKLAELTGDVKALMQKEPTLSMRDAVERVTQGDIVAAVKEIDPEGKIQVVRPHFSDENRALRADASVTPEEAIEDLYSEFTAPMITRKQVAEFLGRIDSRQQAAAAIILRDGTIVNHYSTMMDQMREVHKKILAQRTESKDLIILHSFDSDGSAYLVNSLYGKVNGLKPNQFMSVNQLYACAPGELKGKTVVYLDDVTYSGQQAANNIAYVAPKLRNSGAKVVVGTLGQYEVPADKNFWTGPSRVRGLDKLPNLSRVSAASYKPFFAVDNPNRFASVFLESPELLHETAGGPEWSKSSIASSIVLPYGGPNNNITLLNRLVRDSREANRPVMTPDSLAREVPRTPTEASAVRPAQFFEGNWPRNDNGQMLDSKGNILEDSWPQIPANKVEAVRAQVRSELAQVKGAEGKNVLQKLDASNLSPEQRARVLDALGEAREHYARNFATDPDQPVNWIHTQGELGRVIDAAAAAKATPEETEDALLASMFSDSIKTKANFTTHHLDGELAAAHILKDKFGGKFTPERLNGILHAIREHQIAPPEFMAMIYKGAIQRSIAGEGRAATSEENAALDSLHAKMSNPEAQKLVDAADGGKKLLLTDEEVALLRRTGNDAWYVPSEENSWNKISRALIDGDGIDNYATAGGLSKIIQIRGPETAMFFKDGNFRFEKPGNENNPFPSSSQESWRRSYRDFTRVASADGLRVAQAAVGDAETAAINAQSRVDDWLHGRLGLPHDQQLPVIPGWTGHPQLDAGGKVMKDAAGRTIMVPDNLKYPEVVPRWWSIHNTPPGTRTSEDQAWYEDPVNRYAGLNEEEIKQFKLAKEIRDRYASELRKEQRVAGDNAPVYAPVP